jgi:hypothetical protein
MISERDEIKLYLVRIEQYRYGYVDNDELTVLVKGSVNKIHEKLSERITGLNVFDVVGFDWQWEITNTDGTDGYIIYLYESKIFDVTELPIFWDEHNEALN